MKVLLDTHIALWAVTGSPLLPPAAERLILAADEVFVSAASVWEVAIKHALGRGDVPVSSAQALQAFADAGYTMLPVMSANAVRVEDLPPLHRDPFDRLLVAQALDSRLTTSASARPPATRAASAQNPGQAHRPGRHAQLQPGPPAPLQAGRSIDHGLGPRCGRIPAPAATTRRSA